MATSTLDRDRLHDAINMCKAEKLYAWAQTLDDPMNIDSIGINEIGEVKFPLVEEKFMELCNWLASARRPHDTGPIIVDKTQLYEPHGKPLKAVLKKLATTAVQETFNIDQSQLSVNVDASLDRLIICSGTELYRGIINLEREPGTFGTLLIQIPIQNVIGGGAVMVQYGHESMLIQLEGYSDSKYYTTVIAGKRLKTSTPTIISSTSRQDFTIKAVHEVTPCVMLIASLIWTETVNSHPVIEGDRFPQFVEAVYQANKALIGWRPPSVVSEEVPWLNTNAVNPTGHYFVQSNVKQKLPVLDARETKALCIPLRNNYCLENFKFESLVGDDALILKILSSINYIDVELVVFRKKDVPPTNWREAALKKVEGNMKIVKPCPVKTFQTLPLSVNLSRNFSDDPLGSITCLSLGSNAHKGTTCTANNLSNSLQLYTAFLIQPKSLETTKQEPTVESQDESIKKSSSVESGPVLLTMSESPESIQKKPLSQDLDKKSESVEEGTALLIQSKIIGNILNKQSDPSQKLDKKSISVEERADLLIQSESIRSISKEQSVSTQDLDEKSISVEEGTAFVIQTGATFLNENIQKEQSDPCQEQPDNKSSLVEQSISSSDEILALVNKLVPSQNNTGRVSWLKFFDQLIARHGQEAIKCFYSRDFRKFLISFSKEEAKIEELPDLFTVKVLMFYLEYGAFKNHNITGSLLRNIFFFCFPTASTEKAADLSDAFIRLIARCKPQAQMELLVEVSERNAEYLTKGDDNVKESMSYCILAELCEKITKRVDWFEPDMNLDKLLKLVDAVSQLGGDSMVLNFNSNIISALHREQKRLDIYSALSERSLKIRKEMVEREKSWAVKDAVVTDNAHLQEFLRSESQREAFGRLYETEGLANNLGLQLITQSPSPVRAEVKRDGQLFFVELVKMRAWPQRENSEQSSKDRTKVEQPPPLELTWAIEDVQVMSNRQLENFLRSNEERALFPQRAFREAKIAEHLGKALVSMSPWPISFEVVQVEGGYMCDVWKTKKKIIGLNARSQPPKSSVPLSPSPAGFSGAHSNEGPLNFPPNAVNRELSYSYVQPVMPYYFVYPPMPYYPENYYWNGEPGMKRPRYV